MTNTIIFIGPQGSGKGTQAQLLVQKTGAEYVEMGALLRKTAATDTEFGRKVKSIIEGGNLVDDPTWYEVIRQKLAELASGIVAIFDGSPRNIDQAHLLIDYLFSHGRDKVVTFYITLPREESVRRLMLRRVCSNCKTPAIFNGDENQVCAKCGGLLVRRSDDTPEAINVRLDVYEKQTLPVLDFLKEKTEFHQIDGNRPIEAISADINRILGL